MLSTSTKADVQTGLATGTTVLDYSLQTHPDPLEITPQGAASSSSTVTIIVSNGTNHFVTLDTLTFAIPIGSNAKDLMGDSQIATNSPQGWSVAKTGGTITATPPPDGKRIGPGGLTFIFTLTVNSQVGTAPITITEVTQGADGPVKNQASLLVAKFPAGFTVSELTASPLIVEPGGATTLSWQGADLPGTSYTLEYGTVTKPGLPATDSVPVEGLEATTVFYLVVTATVGQEQVTIERERTVTVNRVEILAFEGPAAVLADQKVTLSWETQNAISCELRAGNHMIDADAPANTEGYQVDLAGSPTEYILVAEGADDQRSSEQRVTVYAIAYEAEATIRLPGTPTFVALAPSGDALYVSYLERAELSVVSTADHTITASIALDHATDGAALLVNADGDRLYVGSGSGVGTVSVVDVEEKAVVKTVSVPGADSMALSTNGETLYAYSHDNGILSTIDTGTLEVVHTLALDMAARGIVLYPDGESLLVLYPFSALRVNLTTRTKGVEQSMPSSSGFATFTSDGASIYVSSFNGALLIVEADSLAITGQIAVGSATAGVSLLPDFSAALVLLPSQGQAALLDTDTKAFVQHLTVGKQPVNIALSPDGRTAYVANVESQTVSVLTR